MRSLIFLLALVWAASGLAQSKFTVFWNPICTMGDVMASGCDDIRSREIVDAQATPWRAIGRVNFASLRQKSHCTGVLVSEELVLTAAHCLYNQARKRWIPASSIKFVAGYQRGEAAAASVVKSYRLDPAQAREGNFEPRAGLDWAVLQLAEPIGQHVGYLPIVTTTRSDAFVAGYSGLRPHVLSRTERCSPSVVTQNVIEAMCPVMMGDSGAPLLVQTSNGLGVSAILSRIAPTPDGIDAIFLSPELFRIDDP